MYWTSQCTEHPPIYWWYSPNILNVPQCTHGIPRMYWTPPMYWTSPDLLNTNYTGCSYWNNIGKLCKVCTISFERPVNYLCDAWHVFSPKYEAWTHFNRPWTEYQRQGVVWTLLIIFTESVNRSTCLSVYVIITRLRNVFYCVFQTV